MTIYEPPYLLLSCLLKIALNVVSFLFLPHPPHPHRWLETTTYPAFNFIVFVQLSPSFGGIR